MLKTIALFALCLSFALSAIASAADLSCLSPDGSGMNVAEGAEHQMASMLDTPCHPMEKGSENGSGGADDPMSDCCAFMVMCGAQIVLGANLMPAVALHAVSLKAVPAPSEEMAARALAPPTEPPKALL